MVDPVKVSEVVIHNISVQLNHALKGVAEKTSQKAAIYTAEGWYFSQKKAGISSKPFYQEGSIKGQVCHKLFSQEGNS